VAAAPQRVERPDHAGRTDIEALQRQRLLPPVPVVRRPQRVGIECRVGVGDDRGDRVLGARWNPQLVGQRLELRRFVEHFARSSRRPWVSPRELVPVFWTLNFPSASALQHELVGLEDADTSVRLVVDRRRVRRVDDEPSRGDECQPRCDPFKACFSDHRFLVDRAISRRRWTSPTLRPPSLRPPSTPRRVPAGRA
jgi:hypothetical protein